MRPTIFFLLISISFMCSACDPSTKTKPVKNNVLKEYVKTPLDKTKAMKTEIEAKQKQAQDQLKAIGD